jgi:hypothetical protein
MSVTETASEPVTFVVPGDSDNPAILELQRKVDLHLRDKERERLNRMQRALDAEQGRLERLKEQREKCRVERDEYTMQIAHLDRSVQYGGADGAAVEAQREKLVDALTRVSAKWDRIQKQIDAGEAPNPLGAVLDALGKTKGDLIFVSPPQMPKGRSPIEMFDETNAKIVALELRKEDTATTTPPIEVLKARGTAAVEKLAAAGKPNVLPMFLLKDRKFVEGLDKREKRATWGNLQWPLDYAEGVRRHEPVIHGTALMAWLHKDALIARVHAEIEANFKPDRAMTDEERTAAIAALDAEIEALEYEACGYAALAEDQGLAVEYKIGSLPRPGKTWVRPLWHRPLAILQVREIPNTAA